MPTKKARLIHSLPTCHRMIFVKKKKKLSGKKKAIHRNRKKFICIYRKRGDITMNETLFHEMTIFSVFDYVNDFFNYVYFKKVTN